MSHQVGIHLMISNGAAVLKDHVAAPGRISIATEAEIEIRLTSERPAST
jgi:pentose-5-phosphate-3-epimerase